MLKEDSENHFYITIMNGYFYMGRYNNDNNRIIAFFKSDEQ